MKCATIGKAMGLCIPSGIKKALTRAHYRKRFGLIIVGDGDGLQIIDSVFGRHCRVTPPVYIGDSSLGDYSYLEPYSRLSSTDIGKFCSIGPMGIIGPLGHPLEHVSTHPAFYLRSEQLRYTFMEASNDKSAQLRTRLGNDVWVGAGVFVRRGVTIGDGAVIGAGSVVTNNVPPYAIVAGVPGRVIRMRFAPNTIKELLKLQWWHRDETWLRQHSQLFRDPEAMIFSAERGGL